jgi:hypothetical protein
MKVRNTIAMIAVLATTLQVSSQNPDDALRYSQLFYTGTARFSAMGGAFTALGGDLSSIGINPAGTGVFRRSEFSFTPHIGYTDVTTYFTSRGDDFRYNFNIGQLGVVMPIIQNNSESGLISLNFGYAYNLTNDYGSNMVIRGVNSTSSMADYWASSSNGIKYSNLSGIAAKAFDFWLMDTISGTDGMEYGTIFSRYGETGSTYGQTVRRVVSSEGFSGEHSFSLAANYNNNLFFGATVGMSRFNYTANYDHLETDPQNDIFDFNSLSYVDHYEANATGYSLKAGVIFLPVDFLRIGLAVHSPTIYRVSELYDYGLSTTFDNGDNYEFSSEPFRFEYRLTTPYRVMGGVALQVMKSALLSVDYELVDYSMSRFSKATDGYQYFDENQAIKEIFKRSHNIRAGAEYRLGSLYFRGGYGYYGKVFNEDEANRDTFHSSVSGGVGFRQSSFYFDLGKNRHRVVSIWTGVVSGGQGRTGCPIRENTSM